jgi:hypothetical protein
MTPFGNFMYEKMAYDVAGDSATFSKVMDAMLMELWDIECLVYLDDILIFSATIEEHACWMRSVFEHI